MTVKITKKSVKLVQEKLYSITLNMQYLNGGGTIVLIDQDFTQKYRTGDNPATTINKFKTVMQGVIDGYKAEQTIFNTAALDTAITTLQNGLTA